MWALSDGRLTGDPADLIRSLPGSFEPLLAGRGRIAGRGDLNADPAESRFVSVVIDRTSRIAELDYAVPVQLQPRISVGSIVRVPLRGRSTRAWVTRVGSTTDIDVVRPVQKILGGMPVFGPAELATARWISRYYLGAMWQVLRHFDPPSLPNPIPSHEGSGHEWSESTNPGNFGVELWEHQPAELPVERLASLIGEVVRSGRSALIAASDLDGNGMRKLIRAVDDPVLVGTVGPQSARHFRWMRAASMPSTVIGGRGAVFFPAQRVGLIVIIGDGDPALKEQASPCYNAREVGVVRAIASGSRVVICSSNPSAEARSWAETVRRPATSATLSGRAVVEIAHRYDEPPGLGPVGERAVSVTRSVLRDGGRALLFLNRTGGARALRCRGCNALRRCANCSGSLAAEKGASELKCRRCSSIGSLACPACGSARTRPLGGGTATLLRAAERLFPGVEIARADRESDRPGPRTSLIVGTESAYYGGAEFSLVVFIDFDSMVLRPDAYAAEDAFRLIDRAAASLQPDRSRAGTPGILIQTYLATHPVLDAAMKGSSEVAMESVLAEREVAQLPPFARAVTVTLKGAEASSLAHALAKSVVGAGGAAHGPQIDKDESRLLVIARDPIRVWPVLAESAAVARAAGCRVRTEVDPLRLE